jgi:NAD(P)-dependent dehydrogenase (short-subunit alcohol dehydrogenase family)
VTAFSNRLSGRGAIVTGATSGIGESIARRFSAEGATVVLVGRRREKGEGVVSSIRGQGGKAFFVEADVSDSGSVEAMTKLSMESLGGNISILVNDAGVSTGNAPMERVTEGDWDKVMDTNAKGTFLCSKAMIPHIVSNGGGSIVNISSAGGLRGYAGGTAYASSKAAVIVLTKIIAMEHGKDKIRANCICPGSVRSEMFDEGIKGFVQRSGGQTSSDQMIANIARGVPLGRIGTPEEVASLALYLSSDEASFLNGAVVVCDGGQTL